MDITPDHPLPLFGRQGRESASTSVTSPLEANIVVINDGDSIRALVTLDTLYPSQTLLDAVHTKLVKKGRPFAQDMILMVASHTHNAPALDPSKPLLGHVDPDYSNEVAKRIAALVIQLAEHPGAAVVLRAGKADCEASVYRRRCVVGIDFARLRLQRRVVMAPNKKEKIDQRLRLFIWSDAQDKPLAAVWHWACHAVSEPDQYTISADFPGFVRESLRDMLGKAGLPVLYLPGFSGDIRPASSGKIPILRSEKWAGLGRRFASNSQAAQTMLVTKINAAMRKAYDAMESVPSTPNTSQTKTINLQNIRRNHGSQSDLCSVNDWAFGGLKLTAVSAEVSHRYGTIGAICDVETGCAQQVFGYLPTDAQIIEGGYEATGFAKAFSLAGQFRDKIEETVAIALQRT